MIEMGLQDFLTRGDRIERLEVLSFHSAPAHVGLVNSMGEAIYIVNNMRDIDDRTELGVLGFVDDRKSSDHTSASNETFPGGRLLAVEYLAAPGFDLVSGVRIRLDIGDLTITAGDMPYSIFMSLGNVQRGRPEYPVDQYRSINPA